MSIIKTRNVQIGGAVLVALILFGLIVSSLLNSSPDFSDYEAGPERKKAFFDYFAPIIAEENAQILEERAELEAAIESGDNLGWWQSYKLSGLADKYKLKDFDPEDKAQLQTLLKRVDIVPPSMALAQAANESAWGTSRFATEGNNFFGQWCYVEGCGLVPKNRNAGAKHEVADFDSPRMSVRAYMNNLNTHQQYKTLRNIRAQKRNSGASVEGLALIEGLHGYSERGAEYVTELRAMITQNKLQQYDS